MQHMTLLITYRLDFPGFCTANKNCLDSDIGQPKRITYDINLYGMIQKYEEFNQIFLTLLGMLQLF